MYFKIPECFLNTLLYLLDIIACKFSPVSFINSVPSVLLVHFSLHPSYRDGLKRLQLIFGLLMNTKYLNIQQVYLWVFREGVKPAGNEIHSILCSNAKVWHRDLSGLRLLQLSNERCMGAIHLHMKKPIIILKWDIESAIFGIGG